MALPDFVHDDELVRTWCCYVRWPVPVTGETITCEVCGSTLSIDGKVRP